MVWASLPKICASILKTRLNPRSQHYQQEPPNHGPGQDPLALIPAIPRTQVAHALGLSLTGGAGTVLGHIRYRELQVPGHPVEAEAGAILPPNLARDLDPDPFLPNLTVVDTAPTLAALLVDDGQSLSPVLVRPRAHVPEVFPVDHHCRSDPEAAHPPVLHTDLELAPRRGVHECAVGKKAFLFPALHLASLRATTALIALHIPRHMTRTVDPVIHLVHSHDHLLGPCRLGDVSRILGMERKAPIVHRTLAHLLVLVAERL